MNLLALAKGFLEPLFTITLILSATLDSHVKSAKVVIEFQINGAFCSWENDGLEMFRGRNFIDLRFILVDPS